MCPFEETTHCECLLVFVANSLRVFCTEIIIQFGKLTVDGDRGVSSYRLNPKSRTD